ncbi:hypothetical protein OQA88_13469 [Cercophora sp. LCS_1]
MVSSDKIEEVPKTGVSSTSDDKTPSISEKGGISPAHKKGESEIVTIPRSDFDSRRGEDHDDDDKVISSGADAANHLMSLRDDFEPALTFRSIVLASCLSAFQAVMTQIYAFKPTTVSISGTFIVLIAYFLGNAWATFLPRGDRMEAKWRAKNPEGAKLPLYITVASFINSGSWNLKEHAICAITATSASNAKESLQVFAAQELFYDLPIHPITVVLTVISVGLLGYGICGIMRPMAVWHVEAVYWSTIPTVKVLQSLHWEDLKGSKPLRWFWYSFIGMFLYEFFPQYIIPWLNSVSIPCLAAMHATGEKAAVLKNLFGGSLPNQGLGWFTFTFDWQYVTSFTTSLPLKWQLHYTAGVTVCSFAMLALYYSNAFNARSLPFMSTRLLTAEGKRYPIEKIFFGGRLHQDALQEHGIPRLTATFAYGMFMANAAIGALVGHCTLFWGGDVVRSFKSARQGVFQDRHHRHMAKHYKEVSWWWYMIVLVGSFALGLIVVTTQNITFPVWAFFISIALGFTVAPLSTLLYSRFGNGIATNNLSKMLAGLILPELPVGNMYFAAWSHSVIMNAVNLSNDLKMGEYLKIPPRVMFLTQIYGTVLGGFVNYAVMKSIVTTQRELLIDGDGTNTWSGASIQGYNTTATSWALAKYLYKAGQTYAMVPLGLLVGFLAVAVHRFIYHFNPKIKGFDLQRINLPQFIQASGEIPVLSNQTCVILSMSTFGLINQLYVRRSHPRIFKQYSYLVTGAWDGAALMTAFLLSFTVFGAGGISAPFPKWWGNNVDGTYDHCPTP